MVANDLAVASGGKKIGDKTKKLLMLGAVVAVVAAVGVAVVRGRKR